jgi:hypothetical protein
LVEGGRRRLAGHGTAHLGRIFVLPRTFINQLAEKVLG